MDPSLDINRALRVSVRGLPRDWKRPLVAHDTPGLVLWKQTCCLSTLAWMLHGDLLRIEHAGGTSRRLLRSSQGHAPGHDSCPLLKPFDGFGCHSARHVWGPTT